MNTAMRITAFTTGLAAAFGLALGVGHATGTGPAPEARAHAGQKGHSGHDAGQPAGHAGHDAADHAGGGAPEHLPGGLQISERGYTLSVENPFVTAGSPADLRFRILGTDGRPLTAYQQQHDKELHLIVAPRDLSTFQHLHPTLAADGTWSATTAVPAAGEYRVFADFTPVGAGDGLTLGADLHAAGDLRPAPLPETGRTVTVDGYTVTLGGDLAAGRSSRLTLTVSKDGRPVTDLQPYLGAYGHLVALRAGDLAYLHVHPDTTTPGPEIGFTTTAPSPGGYRLFLDFQHQDTVHTAAFTVTADSTAAAPTGVPTAAPSEEPAGGHGH
ncbi:hypothetical protein [Streptomyces sp. NRRL S-350]|uniref:hypothetical protein n=1 Tax=Streptomyces sp. NRRL S-350 TaxID=1463902 RepID=UPI0004C1389E|nr:hypothetical protein [Streptomyces sp. NRRL S-350]